LTAALAALTFQSADPLAPARDGKVLCIGADAAAKTCDAIGRYSFEADGAISSETRALISASPVIILVTRTPVYMRGELECSQTAGYADQIVGMEVEGQGVPDGQLAGMRTAIAAQMSAALGEGEMCSIWSPAVDGKVTYTATLNGVDKPEMAGEALWIDADAGWTVAP
jgi:hypothetical protein